MSWQAWTFIVLFVLAVIAGAVALGFRFFGTEDRVDPGDRYTREETHPGTKRLARPATAGAVGLLVLGLIILATGLFTVVGTRQVGIETSFNRPTGETYDNGLHWKAPWANVNEMDGAIQYNKYDGDHSVKVRLGNNSVAGADTTIRWEIKQDAADELFVQYKTFDNVRTNLIERNLQVALNEQFQTFDPLEAKWSAGVPLQQQFANPAAQKLREIVGNQVNILDVSISKLDYDDNTEGKINELNAQRAKTATATESVKTAEQQRQANEKLATSPAPQSMLVVIANCVNQQVEKGQNPAGCWPLNLGSGGIMPTMEIPRP